MSKYTDITGEVAITPPLPWSVIQHSRLLPANYNPRNVPDLLLNVQQQDVKTDHGILNEISATAVVPNYRDSTSGNTIVAELQELIDANPEHKFAGEFECDGEELEDFWRVIVHGRRVIRVDPQITWPDVHDGSQGA